MLHLFHTTLSFPGSMTGTAPPRSITLIAVQPFIIHSITVTIAIPATGTASTAAMAAHAILRVFAAARTASRTASRRTA